MAISVESSATAGYKVTTNLTISAPSGLSEDDLIVAVLTAAADDFNTKSGWTLASAASKHSSDAEIQYKLASSTDAGKADFTFNSSTDGEKAGILIRITGHSTNKTLGGEISGTKDGSTTSTPDFSGTYTPTTSDELVIIGINSSADDTGSVSNYRTSDGNISFTEKLEKTSNQNAGSLQTFGVAVGTYGSNSDITSFGADFSGISASAGTEYSGVSSFFVPENNASGSASLLESNGSIFTQNGSSGTNGNASLLEGSPSIFTQSGTGEEPTVWTNEFTNTTNWTNET